MEGSNGSGGVIKKRSSSGCLIIKKKIENRNYGLMEIDGDNHRKFSHQNPVVLNRRLGLEEDEAHKGVSLARVKYEEKVGKVIRVQGKNGVLKIMVNKRRRMDLPPRLRYERKETREMGSSRMEDFVKAEPPHCPGSFSSAMQGMVKDKDDKFEEEDKIEHKKSKIDVKKSFKHKESGIHGRNTSSKALELETAGTGTSLTLGPPGFQVSNVNKEMGEERTPVSETAQRLKSKDSSETKAKRVGSTEKQILREKIRGMLVDAGWKIDHRPRRNRDYLDAVYINPNGTAYWSIIKAYDALKKQLQQDKLSGKPDVGSPAFSSLPEDLLNKLTRQTKKKVREELKRKSIEDNLTGCVKGHGLGDDGESSGSDHKDEKLANSKTQIYKSGKTNLKEKDQDRSDGLSKHSSQMKSLDLRSEKPSGSSTSSLLQRKTSKTISKCTLQPSAFVREIKARPDGCIPYMGKRTILAWLIDNGTVRLGERVQYMNHKRTRVMLEGWITRDGIHCGCCNKILTFSKFELHAHSKVRQPFQNIFLESGASLLDCQFDAWNKQEGSVISGFHNVSVEGGDPENDICSVCGDDGALISCSSCLSAFHQPCLEIKTPVGDWKCGNCLCKFCGGGVAEYGGNELISCDLCLENYHKQSCSTYNPPSSSNGVRFCGLKCHKMYDHLLKILGVKQELEAGFSWSLLQRAEFSKDLNCTLPQRIECNSKLAVALSILDECFIPIFDRKSGINILHNVVYSIRSNLNHLNYQGFYTAILERGDEIVSAACLRIHGASLVEMPFVATREIYRRQGMCHRLLAAIETELHHFGVEHLIIPALPEQVSLWTKAFDFRELEDTLGKEMKTMNLLVSPEMHFLQKDMLKQQYGIKRSENIADHRGVASKTSDALAEVMTDYSTANDSGSGSGSGNSGTLNLKDNADSTDTGSSSSTSEDTEDDE